MSFIDFLNFGHIVWTIPGPYVGNICSQPYVFKLFLYVLRLKGSNILKSSMYIGNRTIHIGVLLRNFKRKSQQILSVNQFCSHFVLKALFVEIFQIIHPKVYKNILGKSNHWFKGISKSPKLSLEVILVLTMSLTGNTIFSI